MTATIKRQERQAMDAFVTQLQESYGNKIRHIALFGSKARGDSLPDSDIDILVILNEEDRSLRREIITLSARISLDYDVLLSPSVIGHERWERQRGFSIYRNIQRDALPLV